AIALAVAAADARRLDEHFAIGCAMDRIRRAILHAMRMLAVTARRRHVQIAERRTRFAIEPRHVAVRRRARLLALIAADAQRFVDQERVGRLAHALLDEELHHLAALRRALRVD